MWGFQRAQRENLPILHSFLRFSCILGGQKCFETENLLEDGFFSEALKQEKIFLPFQKIFRGSETGEKIFLLFRNRNKKHWLQPPVCIATARPRLSRLSRALRDTTICTGLRFPKCCFRTENQDIRLVKHFIAPTPQTDPGQAAIVDEFGC